MSFASDGYVVFPHDRNVAKWAAKAAEIGRGIVAEPDLRSQWLRHDGTWFVGVDALPNRSDGALDGVRLSGPWEREVAKPEAWHKAQLSVVYDGYPGRDAGESDAAHRFRITRAAAHVDGLLAENGRRFLREPHAFVLGLPLNFATACPLVVWPGSHRPMGWALSEAIGTKAPLGVDLTDSYKAARAEVFASQDPIAIRVEPGQSVLLHRHLLHGIAPHSAGGDLPDEGRMMAYFRPELSDPTLWLRG